MFVVAVLVVVATGLFSAAAMWDGPGGALRTWLYN